MTSYQNQYLLTRKVLTPHEKFVTHTFGDYYIYAHKSLQVVITGGRNSEMALIGIAINPLSPMQKEAEIVSNIIDGAENFLDFCGKISALTGRFVGLYFDSQGLRVVGDACNLRAIYYGEYIKDLVVTSSPKLFLDTFGLKPKISEEKKEVIESKLFSIKENAWFGNESLDDRLSKLLPNHYLIAKGIRVKRLPVFTFNWQEKDVLANTVTFLENTYQALILKFNLVQPLTAGWDSRLLLAASKNFRKDIHYYVFGDRLDHQDVRIPLELNAKFDLNFEVINSTIDFDQEFLESFKSHHIIPRISNKTRDIQHHFFNNRDTNTINITGNVGGVLKSNFGVSKTQSSYIIKSFTGYKGIAYVDKQMSKWLPDAKAYAKENNISLLDLFYWEQRMGNWGGDFPAEQDMAIDEIAPLNNRTLLWTLLDLNSKNRKDPNFDLFTKLIVLMWPELLETKINPDKSKMLKITNSNIYLRLLRGKLKRAVNKLKN